MCLCAVFFFPCLQTKKETIFLGLLPLKNGIIRAGRTTITWLQERIHGAQTEQRNKPNFKTDACAPINFCLLHNFRLISAKTTKLKNKKKHFMYGSIYDHWVGRKIEQKNIKVWDPPKWRKIILKKEGFSS